MLSCITTGKVEHQRYAPKAHGFSYSMAMLFLDLDEIPNLKCSSLLFSTQHFRPYSFFRKDFHQPHQGELKTAVLATTSEQTGLQFSGEEKVYILTQARVMGFCFNPVSFYYIYDTTAKTWLAVMAEINNTPWNERHSYAFAIPTSSGEAKFTFAKVFHVSPFMPMDQTYQWTFTNPQQALNIHMENFDAQSNKIFYANLSMKKSPLNNTRLCVTIFKYPFTTLFTICAIYIHALRLKLKGIPYHINPSQQEANNAS